MYPVVAEIDECAAQPCVNAVGCVDHINDYTCFCQTGFTGHDCDGKNLVSKITDALWLLCFNRGDIL